MTDLYILMLINLTIIFIVYSYTYNRSIEKELRQYYIHKQRFEKYIFMSKKNNFKLLEATFEIELEYIKEVINHLKQF